MKNLITPIALCLGLFKRVIAVAATVGSLTFPMFASASVITWDEINAGDLVATAEMVGGTPGTQVGAIRGSLTSLAPVNMTPRYQVDLFKIFISDASAFSASTMSLADTALFLFDDQGRGVYMNDDEPSGLSLLSLLPASDPASPIQSGFYFLGIALGSYLPYDATNLALFLTGGFTDVLAGDSNADPLAYWDATYDSFEESPYSYEIGLTGVLTSALVTQVPEPGSLALLLLGALAIAGLRSRRLHLAA